MTPSTEIEEQFTCWFECFSGCGLRYDVDEVVYQCGSCGGLLEVRHDLDALRSISPDNWKKILDSRLGASSGVWSRKEFVFPTISSSQVVSLGEGNSPLLASPRMAEDLGIDEIYIKQCGTSHTGSFKDLGMTVLVSAVNRIRDKVRAVACASTGDTSAALAAYAAAAGIPAIVFLPRDKISLAQLIQPISNGALTLSIDTDFDGCMKIVREITEDRSIYLANSMNSLRIEGQKSISVEIVQQMGWEVPDYVVVPGGNLGNVSAIGSGFLLLKEIGLIDRLPRLVCAQTEQANPFYRAYLDGLEKLAPVTAQTTMATAIQIGNPVSFPKAVRAIESSNGIVAQASESDLANAACHADSYGFFSDPQTGVALAVLKKLIGTGAIEPRSRVVVISTAHGLKFVDFKLKVHEGRVPDTDSSFRNLPVEVPADVDRVRDVINGKLPAT
jgi:threonine synthase